MLLNNTRKAYPIRHGGTLAPSYVMEKFDFNQVTAEGFVEFLQCLPEGELDVKWFTREGLKESDWQIRRFN